MMTAPGVVEKTTKLKYKTVILLENVFTFEYFVDVLVHPQHNK